MVNCSDRSGGGSGSLPGLHCCKPRRAWAGQSYCSIVAEHSYRSGFYLRNRLGCQEPIPTAHTLPGKPVVLLLAIGTRHEFLARIGRYALSGYPLFAALPGLYGSGRKRLLALALSGTIQLYLAGLFVLWAFIG